MKLKNRITVLGVLAFSLLLISSPTLASTSNGTIDPTYRYAWGENVGFVDFGSTSGDVHITDDTLQGYAYGENIGFINLSNITNDNEGHLSGYAWGENVGFIDFSQVDIDSSGIFTGQAYGENIGFITFNTNDNNKVATDWRPKSTRPHGSSGGGSRTITPIVITPTPANTNCLPGYLFDTNTGKPCTITPNPSDGQVISIISRILKLTTPQMNGTDVKDLQTYLKSHNYNCGIADGIFGKLTKQAIINFQKANQLKGDGIVGPLTRSKLK